jgi:hypothetical protein
LNTPTPSFSLSAQNNLNNLLRVNLFLTKVGFGVLQSQYGFILPERNVHFPMGYSLKRPSYFQRTVSFIGKFIFPSTRKLNSASVWLCV